MLLILPLALLIADLASSNSPSKNACRRFCYFRRYLNPVLSPSLSWLPVSPQHLTTHVHLTRLRPIQSNNRNDISSDELALLEKQVLASVKSRIDLERIMKALNNDDAAASRRPKRNDLMYDNEDLARPQTTPWQVASAAAIVSGGVSYVAFDNIYLSAGVCCCVFVAACLEDEDSLSGALARVLGRSALQSVQASQPKIKAVARAVVTGEEEIVALKAQIRQLQEENAALKQWKERRMMIDESLPRYSVAQLREMARQNGLPESGTKTELLLRLVEAYEIRLE